MKKISALLLMGLVGLLLTGCFSRGDQTGDPRPMMTGTLSLHDPVVLPRAATLTVRLLDVTRQGAPAVVLTERSRSNPGVPPIEFELPYPYGGISPKRRYVIEARIEVEGRLRYSSMDGHEVTAQNAAQPHDISLVLTKEN